MTTHSEYSLDFSAFCKLCEQQSHADEYPLAQQISSNVPIYQGADLLTAVQQQQAQQYQREFAKVLDTGPGVLVIKNAYTDSAVLDEMDQVFEQLLTGQSTSPASDHFAKAGANGRVWNVFEKSAKENPRAFINYYKNPILALMAQAWLGPHYQMTAQLNIVYPGGTAQQPHRDYHLGFQENSEVNRYPIHIQKMSRYLTLQGGIAHTDMPVTTGPTQLLPFSQQFASGYLAWRDPQFIDYFGQHSIQLPLNRGDAIFFNPALFHAAGDNRSQHQPRSVNLLQISSAFSKPMETVDLYQLNQILYPELQQLFGKTQHQEIKNNERQNTEDNNRTSPLALLQLEAILTASCDSYSFPSNLDTDPPLGSMAPQTAKQLTYQALQQNWDKHAFQRALLQHQARRKS